MKIIPVDPADASALREIIKSQPQSADWTEEQVLAEIANPVSAVLAAEDGGKLIGFISAREVMESAEIDNFAVMTSYARRGIGTALIENLFGVLRDKGVKEITLEVNEHNLPAVSFYKKHGFKTAAKRTRFYGNEDALVMRRDL